ncbi:pacearchaeosortase [Candidatus Woesearchaeota archaeon]|nr:pacearchaeosortase [Candidatus Woesearchaeota archaeon]
MYYLSLIARLLIPFIITINLLDKLIYPATIYSSYFILRLINYQAFIIQPYIITAGNYIRFSQACAAISAYFLLLLLILLTKDIKLKTRIKMFLLGSIIIFSVNLIRILTLIAVLEKQGFNAFQQAHDIIWIIFGSLLVALTWISLIKHYKISSIPIYSDLKYLLKQTKLFKF